MLGEAEGGVGLCWMEICSVPGCGVELILWDCAGVIPVGLTLLLSCAEFNPLFGLQNPTFGLCWVYLCVLIELGLISLLGRARFNRGSGLHWI